jgi:hypothetical protein
MICWSFASWTEASQIKLDFAYRYEYDENRLMNLFQLKLNIPDVKGE